MTFVKQNQLLTPQTQNQIDLTYLANGYYIARNDNESRSTQQKLITKLNPLLKLQL